MIRKFFIVISIIYNLLPTLASAEVSAKPTQSVSDDYLKGYVNSLALYNYNLPLDSISIRDHQIYIHKELINNSSAEQIKLKLELALANIKDVRVFIIDKEHKYIVDKIEKPKVSRSSIMTDGLMPNHSLFEPLIADPKWPRFTLAYHYQHTNHKKLKHHFAPNFGATIPLYRVSGKYDWEVGVQGGLFAIMDIGTNPSALVNADYFIGLPISYHSGQWSGLIRPYHLSSHLGDEFMLTKEGKQVKRINLSYEGIDAILSYNIKGLRLYGGGGYIVHREPSYYKPGKIQVGSEYYAEKTIWDGRLRPVFGIDLKLQEHNNWYPGISVKAGMQIENSILMSNKMQLMLEYYNGKSFHGQFYNDKLRYLGLGLQVFL